MRNALDENHILQTVSFALAQETVKMISKLHVYKVRKIEACADEEPNRTDEAPEAVRQEQRRYQVLVNSYYCSKNGHFQRDCKPGRKRLRPFF